MAITIFILSIMLILSIIAIINLITQVEKQDELIEDALKSETYYRDIIDSLREKVLQAQVRMKEIDIRGSFEADDEVGYTFKSLQGVVDELNSEVNKAYETTDK
jgi:hypothetical protein